MRRIFLNRTVFAAAALAAAVPASAAPAEARVTDRNISVTAFVDAGQVVQGSLVNDDGTNSTEVENLFLNRDGVALTYSGTVNEKLHMNIGVGGLFWKPVPEATDAATKRINFGPGISEASGRYDFTDRASIKFGFFGYKYNPDAANLGEYLLRSEAYPTIIQTGSTGGWVWMNSNEYKSMGAQFSWTSPGGQWRHDVLLFSEFNQAPLFDFSPSYVVTGKVHKALEVGAGISFHRWLPIRTSLESPKAPANTYVEIDNFPVYKDPITGKSTRDSATLKEIKLHVGNLVDSLGDPVVTQSVDANGNTIYIRNDNHDTLSIRKSQHLTFQAIKVMGRASLDLTALLGLSEAVTGPFKVFGEVAVLGIENQPYYFEKLSERTPVMIGVDIPTFGILDLLTVQMEYLKNPYPDNNYQQFNNNIPTPTLASDDVYDYGKRLASGQYKNDDLKWSAQLKKTVVTGLDVYLQVANDHFRVQDVNAQPSFMPLTQAKSDWYYMLRFQWSL